MIILNSISLLLVGSALLFTSFMVTARAGFVFMAWMDDRPIETLPCRSDDWTDVAADHVIDAMLVVVIAAAIVIFVSPFLVDFVAAYQFVFGVN